MNSICTPSLTELNERIEGFENDIALMTLAPELKGSLEIISRLRKLNIFVCLWHSSADFDQALTAFQNGVSISTQAFNAMKGMHHRAIGSIGAALRRDEVFLSLIADGEHVHSDINSLLNKIAPKQLFLVSDAISDYGLGDGLFVWDNEP